MQIFAEQVVRLESRAMLACITREPKLVQVQLGPITKIKTRIQGMNNAGCKFFFVQLGAVLTHSPSEILEAMLH